jgi:C_GCAxxG_C_C family probable redox protein
LANQGENMTNGKIAEEKFRSGYNCSQSVLFGLIDELNIDKDTALKISNGFGGGMGRKQEVCGAVSGAIMSLGLLYGRGEKDGPEKQETTYSKVRELIDSFKKEFGTINCKDLLSGCVLMTEEGQKQFKNDGLKERCCNYVRRATEITKGLTTAS